METAREEPGQPSVGPTGRRVAPDRAESGPALPHLTPPPISSAPEHPLAAAPTSTGVQPPEQTVTDQGNAFAMAGQAVAPLLYYAVWLPGPSGAPAGAPIYLPAAGPNGAVPAGAAAPAMAFGGGSPPIGGAGAAEAQAQNQRLLVWTIILCVMAVHLPWIGYLVAVHGCWGTFIDACWQPQIADAGLEGEIDPFAETVGDPYLFARIVILMLRVQAVLSADWAEYSQAMQLSTGLGSFVLTRIVASNGLLMQGRGKAIYLAALCLTLFLILFWAELHLTSDQGYPLLGDDTVLDYISQTLPPDFASYGSVRDGLMQLLQFLRLADALILGACLALPTTTQRKAA